MYNDPRGKNEYKVWFGIYDFECHPNEITKELGIEPTETRIKDKIRFVEKLKHPMKNKTNAWILKSELPVSTSIEKQIQYLINIISRNKQEFIKISKKYYAEFGCALYYYEVNPGIHLD